MTVERNNLLYAFSLILLVGTALLHAGTASAAECDGGSAGDRPATAFVLRLGQGGFRDSRSPDGDVGGGQLALDVARCDWPLSITLSGEYYTRSANPTENYEIDNLYAINLRYAAPLPGFGRTDYFVGGGIGRLEVPDGDNDVEGDLLNFEAGLHWKRFEHFGFYGSLKYLRADEQVEGRKIIDFDETALMLGVTYRFAL